LNKIVFYNIDELMLKIISLYEPYSNFQKNLENEQNFNNQLEEENCHEIFRGFNEYRIKNFSEENLNNEQYIFYNNYIEEANDETEKINLNIQNNNIIRFELMNPLNSYDILNKDFSFSGDYYNSENTLNTFSNIDKIINNNFLFINYITEKKKEGIFISKKRRLFNIKHPKSFYIFNKGGKDNYINQLIIESL